MKQKLPAFVISGLFLSFLTISCASESDQGESKTSKRDAIVEVPPPPNAIPDDIEVLYPEPTAEELADSIPDSDEFVLLEKEPMPLNLDEIKGKIGYPKQAKEQEIEGKVVFRVLLDRAGNYNRHEILDKPNGIFTKAIAAHIKDLRCTPGYQNGRPVWCWINLPFIFKLIK